MHSDKFSILATLAMLISLVFVDDKRLSASDPNPQVVIDSLNDIESQFSGKYVELRLIATPAGESTTYRIWNPADHSHRRLEQQGSGLPKTGVSAIRHYGQLHNRNHYVEASWTSFSNSGAAALSNRGTQPMLAVYDAQPEPFLLPEPAALCEQRCALDKLRLSEILDSNLRDVTVIKSIDKGVGEWLLTLESSQHGVYKITFDVEGVRAIIRAIEVDKAKGCSLLEPNEGPVFNTVTVGEVSTGTYRGLERIRFSITEMEYQRERLAGWKQSVSLRFSNTSVPPGDGTPVTVAVDTCSPFTGEISDRIEFDSFKEADIGIVKVDGDENMVYSVRDGALVKLLDESAAEVARSRRMGDRSARNWWYAIMGTGLVIVTFYLIKRRAMTES